MAKFYKSKFTAAQQDALLDIVEQGGSGGSGEGDGWEYYDTSAIDVNYQAPLYFGGLIKYTQTNFDSEEIAYKGIGDFASSISIGGRDGKIKVIAVAVNRYVLDSRVLESYISGSLSDFDTTLYQHTEGLIGGLLAPVLNCPRITKEQFYTL